MAWSDAARRAALEARRRNRKRYGMSEAERDRRTIKRKDTIFRKTAVRVKGRPGFYSPESAASLRRAIRNRRRRQLYAENQMDMGFGRGSRVDWK